MVKYLFGGTYRHSEEVKILQRRTVGSRHTVVSWEEALKEQQHGERKTKSKWTTGGNGLMEQPMYLWMTGTKKSMTKTGRQKRNSQS